jgi:acetyl-CoA acetyltransferase family protein
MSGVFVYDAVRTPRAKGKPDGRLAGEMPWTLAGSLVDAMRARVGRAALEHVSRLALGCVTQTGPQGGHVALSCRNHARLPVTAACSTINNYCVSGMSALAAAARAIESGDDELALAGGVESMSGAPFEADSAPFYRDPTLAAHLSYLAPPLVADWLATREGITRAELDEVTVRSHARAAAAWDEGRYQRSVVPVQRRDGVLVDRDETFRSGLTVADLARFPAAFAALGAQGGEAFVLAAEPSLRRLDYLHAVPHCPPIADGAALLLLGDERAGAAHSLQPRARIAAHVEVNTDPADPFAAGFAAMERALRSHGLALADVGALEFMEAFAAVPALFRRRHPEAWERANASGGHLALGHPMGASGAILVVTLLGEMERLDSEWGLAVAHAVGGVGAAVLLQRE